jgi:hypothetical protein
MVANIRLTKTQFYHWHTFACYEISDTKGLSLNVCASALSPMSCLTCFRSHVCLPQQRFASGDSRESFGRGVSTCGITWGSRRSRHSPTMCHLPTSLSSSVRSLSDIERTLESTASDMYGTTPRNFGRVVMTFGSFLPTVVDSETEGVQVPLRGVSREK